MPSCIIMIAIASTTFSQTSLPKALGPLARALLLSPSLPSSLFLSLTPRVLELVTVADGDLCLCLQADHDDGGDVKSSIRSLGCCLFLQDLLQAVRVGGGQSGGHEL